MQRVQARVWGRKIEALIADLNVAYRTLNTRRQLELERDNRPPVIYELERRMSYINSTLELLFQAHAGVKGVREHYWHRGNRVRP